MAYYKLLLLYLAILILFAGCKSSTLIQSSPTNAKIYINNEYKGLTPYHYSDRKMTGSVTDLKIVKDGYEPFIYHIKRDEKVNYGAIICGFSILPFLWIMEYNPTHSYELIPTNKQPIKKDSLDSYKTDVHSNSSNDEYSLLKDLKNLFELKILNENEYNTARKNLTGDNPSRKKIKYQDVTLLLDLKKSLNDDLITAAEFESKKSKILALDKGFEIGEQVEYVLPSGQKITGTIKEFKNNNAILEYTRKYLFETSIEQVEAFISKLIKIQPKP